MLEHLRVKPGIRAAEAGCGSGVLSLYLALSGAAAVVGTDIDHASLVLARHNARLNGITNTVFVQADLLEAVAGPLELIVALLPHKPGPRPFSKRFYGGPDGTGLLLRLATQARRLLTPGGRLYLYLNSVTDTGRVLETLQPDFDLLLRGEKRRHFEVAEMETLCPGIFPHWQQLQAEGRAEFARDEAGLFFLARIYEAVRR